MVSDVPRGRESGFTILCPLSRFETKPQAKFGTLETKMAALNLKR